MSSMMPMRAATATGTSEAPGTTRGRGPLDKDDEFGAILADVAQDEASSPASMPLDGLAVPSTATTAAPKSAPALDVDTLLAQLVSAAPIDGSAAAATTTRSTAKTTHDAKSKSGDAAEETDGDPGEPAATTTFAASIAAPTTGLAQAAPPIATVEVRTIGQGGPSGAKDAQALQGGRTGQAIVTDPARSTGIAGAPRPEPEPIVPSVASSADDAAGVKTSASTQAAPVDVAVIQVASHPAPARPLARAAAQAATDTTPTAVEGSSAKTKAGIQIIPSEPASAADDQSDAQADHKPAVAAPLLQIETIDAAAGDHPARQIAEAVTTLAADASHAEAATAQATARPSPTRSLVLHLAPASLGTVTVRLHLAEGGLSVRLSVDNQATLGLLNHSREALQAAIGATCKLDQIVIQGADTAPPTNAGSHDTTRSDGGAAADQQAGGQRDQEGSSRQPARSQPHEARASSDRRADGLFI